MNMSKICGSRIWKVGGSGRAPDAGGQHACCARCSSTLSSAPPALVLISMSFGPSGVMWKSKPKNTPRLAGARRAIFGAFASTRSRNAGKCVITSTESTTRCISRTCLPAMKTGTSANKLGCVSTAVSSRCRNAGRSVPTHSHSWLKRAARATVSFMPAPWVPRTRQARARHCRDEGWPVAIVLQQRDGEIPCASRRPMPGRRPCSAAARQETPRLPHAACGQLASSGRTLTDLVEARLQLRAIERADRAAR